MSKVSNWKSSGKPQKKGKSKPRLIQSKQTAMKELRRKLKLGV